MPPASAAILQQSSGDASTLWPSVALAAAGVTTGLGAGIFAAFQVAILPGLNQVGDEAFVATFQAINRAIVNPAFLAVFFGAPIVIGIATAGWWRDNRSVALWLGIALALQVANLAITIGGNIPLNDALAEAGTVSGAAATTARRAFEAPWRRLHTIRTLASVASTVAIGVAAIVGLRD